jgi:hypothetical protein
MEPIEYDIENRSFSTKLKKSKANRLEAYGYLYILEHRTPQEEQSIIQSIIRSIIQGNRGLIDGEVQDYESISKNFRIDELKVEESYMLVVMFVKELKHKYLTKGSYITVLIDPHTNTVKGIGSVDKKP